ncbi:MAG: FKBP-type peptidyl-prolyl cis-trans isomerase [Phycisphaeraceae bacterium]|nr:FKBP-type peptidyl-prolyl cis-trans isomerase [Phycisphaeraceae bacterium]
MPTTPGGVEIEEITLGDGDVASLDSIVIVHYHGTLKSSGKVFDSTQGGSPIEFPLEDLIKGWQEGIPGMKIGGKRKLTIPWGLAYGAAGAPPDIPPKADLVFEIELVDLK